MKELSIEQKAVAYDKAKDIMEKYLKTGNAGVIAENTIKNAFPELRENEDKKIIKEIISIVKSYRENCITEGYHNFDSCLAWLKTHGGQKPTDKVEPKFHKGDWVVQENVGIYKVIEVCESWYEVVDNKDKHYSIGFDKENMCHLWTLQDAKPGDVLDANGAPFIYKKHDKDYVYFYCGFNLAGDFVVAHGIDAWNGTNKVYPITKEQSEFFFKNMKENGYTWDPQKKELKKILVIDEGKAEIDYCFTKMMNGEKVSSTWSVEDEFKVQRICKYLDEAKKYYADITEIRDCIDWLKFIQNKISTQNIKSPLWKKVDQPIYINTKDIALVQKKDQSDVFKGCLLYLDHTLDPKVDERYILLNDLL